MSLAGADLDRLTGFQYPVSIFKSIGLQCFRHKSGIFLGLKPCQRFTNKMTGFQNETNIYISLILIKETSNLK